MYAVVMVICTDNVAFIEDNLTLAPFAFQQGAGFLGRVKQLNQIDNGEMFKIADKGHAPPSLSVDFEFSFHTSLWDWDYNQNFPENPQILLFERPDQCFFETFIVFMALILEALKLFEYNLQVF
ncbi:hypothetical protein [Geotalea toluenoxydans]|uniref:hypothetical protein n=1 Tax=Geotalea toluenoxydans TaxID=421624 RepID=UPI001FB3CB6A|nr:hypothetical protein [Geotalea toluenoxydans]